MSAHPHGHSCEHGHPCAVYCSDSHPHFCDACWQEAIDLERPGTPPEDDPHYQHDPTVTMA